MRYRMLTKEELNALSEDFTQFLVVQGIDDDSWRKMNLENKEKAIQIVEIFSDTVLAKVYSKIKYLSYVSDKVYSIFRINKDNINLILIKSTEPTFAFKNENLIPELLSNHPNSWELYSSTKHLGEKVTDEIHKLVTQGCQISKEETWNIFYNFHKKASKKASF